jgi:hypothetical protein
MSQICSIVSELSMLEGFQHIFIFTPENVCVLLFSWYDKKYQISFSLINNTDKKRHFFSYWRFEKGTNLCTDRYKNIETNTRDKTESREWIRKGYSRIYNFDGNNFSFCPQSESATNDDNSNESMGRKT